MMHAILKRGCELPSLDADHPHFETFCNAPDSPDIPRVEVARQSNLGIIRQADHLALTLELVQRRNGAYRIANGGGPHEHGRTAEHQRPQLS